MSKHTPTPWRQDPYVDAIHILAADGSKVAMLADRRLDSIGMPPDNARFIVRACNAHEELLEALQYARLFGNQGTIDFSDNPNHVGKSVSYFIDRAIAKASI